MRHEGEIVRVVPFRPPTPSFVLNESYLTSAHRVINLIGYSDSDFFPLLFRYEDTGQLVRGTFSGKIEIGFYIVAKYP